MNDAIMTRNHLLTLDHAGEAAKLLQARPLLGEKIATATQLTQEQVPAMLTEVLRYLSLSRHSKQTLSPPMLLDLAWHEFILFTRLYHDWCIGCLGAFVHHAPGGGETENRSRLRLTLKRYGLFFGPPEPRFWGNNAYYSEPADCGACSTD